MKNGIGMAISVMLVFGIIACVENEGDLYEDDYDDIVSQDGRASDIEDLAYVTEPKCDLSSWGISRTCSVYDGQHGEESFKKCSQITGCFAVKYWKDNQLLVQCSGDAVSCSTFNNRGKEVCENDYGCKWKSGGTGALPRRFRLNEGWEGPDEWKGFCNHLSDQGNNYQYQCSLRRHNGWVINFQLSIDVNGDQVTMHRDNSENTCDYQGTISASGKMRGKYKCRNTMGRWLDWFSN